MTKKERKDYQNFKSKKHLRIFYRNVYSRLIINFFFIAMQIFLLTLFILRLEKYLEVYFGTSLAASALFMIYMVNKNGKNEFKLAWIVPMIFAPLFCVAAYFMYHTNRGARHHSEKLSKLCSETDKYLPAIIKQPSESSCQDLVFYLSNSSSFYPYENCSVEYFSNGESFFPKLMELIRSAENYIFMEFFIIELDDSFAEIMKALEERVAHGVKVRILCDGLGSPAVAAKSFQKYLMSKGIESRVFIPIVPVFSTNLNNRDHRKMIIIDGKTAFTGGLNIANEYFNRGKNRFAYWKDNAVLIHGGAIHTMMQLFLQNWNLCSKDSEDISGYLSESYEKYNCKGLTIPYGDNFYNNKDIAENIYLYIINNSRKYLNITTPYILIDNQIQEALFFAAERGVEVSIILPSVPDHFLTFCIGKTFLKTFVENGIKVYLYQKGFIHSKTFISDNQIATIGSVNLDYRSLYHHFENGIVFIDSPVVESVKADFDETIKECTLMQKDDYKKIPLYMRFFGRMFRIFAPLL